jgi:hypothetical protein
MSMSDLEYPVDVVNDPFCKMAGQTPPSSIT